MGLINRRHIEEWEESAEETKTVSRDELLKHLQENSDNTQEQGSIDLNDVFYQPLSLYQKLSAKKILCLDIGTDKLFYLVGKKAKDRVRVVHWGEETLTGDELDRYRSIEVALKYIRSNIYKSGMAVHAVFFSPDINIRQEVIPKLKPAEMRKTIHFKNKSELPSFDDNTVWSYQILEEFVEADVKKVRVLVTAVPGDVIDIYFDILRRSGFKPQTLIPRPFALLAAYSKMVKNHRNDVIIDIGTDTTQVCYITDKKLRYVRDFAVGANNLQKAIGSGNGNGNGNGNLMENTGAMEEIKEGEDQTNMRERLLRKVKMLKSNQNPLLQVLLSEILRSMEFFRGKKDENPINNIYLTGAGVKIESVFPYLKNRLSYSINILVPRLFKENPSATDYGDLTAALGAGVFVNKHINLISAKFRVGEIFRNLNFLVSAFIILFIVFAAYLSFSTKKEIDRNYATIKKTTLEYQKLNPVENLYDKLVEQIKTIDREKKQLLAPVKPIPQLMDILKLFSNEVPPKIYLTRLTFNGLSLDKDAATPSKEKNAESPNYKYIVGVIGRIQGDYLMGDVILINFINKLNDLNYFKDIQIIKKSKEPDKQYLEFELSAHL